MQSAGTSKYAYFAANVRMQDYEKQVRLADRLRRRELYYGQQNEDTSRRG